MADGKIVIDVLLDDGQVVKGVANIDKQLGGLQGSGEKGAVGIGKIVTALGLVGLAKKGIDMVKGSLDKAFGRIDTMEQFQRVMTTMTGSTEKANDVLNKTNNVVKGTAYGLDVGARAVQNFVTSNLEVDKATGTLAAWGDAVAFYGDGSNATFSSVTDAIAKMVAKGKVQMDTMNSFTEAGIPAMQIYADATGQSVEAVADQMSKGELDAKKFLDVMNNAFVEGTKGFASIDGAAKEAGASWGGSFDNMKAAVARGVTSIIQSIDNMLMLNGLPDMRTMVAVFGSKFEEVLNKVANSIPKVVEKIKEVYENLEPWMPLIQGVVIAIGTFVGSIATMNSVISIATSVWKGLNKVIAMNPWVLIGAAIVTAAVLVYTHWEPIKEFFIKLWDSIKNTGIAIWDWLRSVWESAVTWLKDAWSSVSTFFMDLWKSIGKSGVAIWDRLKNIWRSVVDFFRATWESISGFFIGLWNGIVSVAVSIWDRVVERWNTVVGFIKEISSPMIEFFRSLWDTVGETATTIWDNATSFLSTTWENIQIIASSAWEIIKNAILGPILLLINLVTGDMDEFKSNLTSIWENIKGAAERIWEVLKEIVTTYINTLVENATALWEGFIEILVSLWEALKETASNVWKAIVDAVVKRVESLGQKFEKTMEFIKNVIDTAWAFIEKLWLSVLESIINATGVDFDSMRDNIKAVMDAIKDIIDTVWNFIKEAFQLALLTIRALVTGDFATMKDMIGEQMTLIKDTITKIWDNIKKIFNNTLKALKTFVITRFENMKSATKQKMDDMRTSISNTWDTIKTMFSTVLENLKTTVKNKFNDLKNSAKDKMNETKDKIKEIWNNVMTFFRDIDLMQIGKDIIQGLINGITSKVEAVGRAVKNVTDAITGKIKDILNIHSPSRWMRDMIGKNMMLGWQVGIEREKRSSEKMAEKATDWMTPDVPTVGSFVNRLRGMTAPVGDVMPISVGNGGTNSSTITNTRTFSPQITNYFTPEESTPSESARKQQQLVRRLGMEF